MQIYAMQGNRHGDLTVICFFRKDKKEDVSIEETDRHSRILEIQARIATLRSSLGGTEESNQDTSIQPEHVVVQEEQLSDASDQKRNKELDDIKQKLRGRM